MILAIEGIDGAGKGTQAELLNEKMKSQNVTSEILSFPRYGQTMFAKCVAAYLNAEFGDLASISPKAAALLYAGDRYESLHLIMQLARSHDWLIFDRYVASNLAHQAAKISEEGQPDFISWLSQLEFEVFGLPKPDITIYLDMPTKLAFELIHKKKQRNYTTEAADLHEKDIEYLDKCRQVYQNLARTNFDSRWFVIQCVSSDGQLLKAADIHEHIWSILEHDVYMSEKSKG